MTINIADAIYIGDLAADRVYLGDVLVWELASSNWGPLETMYRDAVVPSAPNDPNQFALGSKFTVLTNGRIVGTRIFHLDNSPMRSGRPVVLWTATGTKLAEAVTTSEANGWNVIEFPVPVIVKAGEQFVMSWGYFGAGTDGSFAYSNASEYLNSPSLQFDAGMYAVPATDPAGFPPNAIMPNNYYADVVFQAGEEVVEWGPGERMLDPAVIPSTVYTGDYTTGVLFTVVADGRITHLCNRNYDQTSAGRLKLYDDATRTLLGEVVSAPPVYGQQNDMPLSTPVEVTAGRKYMVSFHADGEQATTYPYLDGQAIPVSLSPNLINMRGTYYAGQTYPTEDGNQYYWLDVIYQKKVGEAAWDDATQAFLDASGLDVSYAPALDGLVKGLKGVGLWDKMVAVYPFIGGTADLHKWNLIDPRDADDAFRLTYTSGSAPGGHSSALGYRPNAVGAWAAGGWADSHLVPSSHMGVNSTHLSVYSLENTPSGDRAEIGNFAYNGVDARFHVIARYIGVDGFYYGQGEHGATHAVVPAADGLFVATRTAADWQGGYRNGVLQGASGVTPNAGLPSIPVAVGAITGFANHSDMAFGFASIGAGLDAVNVADLHTVVRDYQIALGRQPLTSLWE